MVGDAVVGDAQGELPGVTAHDERERGEGDLRQQEKHINAGFAQVGVLRRVHRQENPEQEEREREAAGGPDFVRPAALGMRIFEREKPDAKDGKCRGGGVEGDGLAKVEQVVGP